LVRGKELVNGGVKRNFSGGEGGGGAGGKKGAKNVVGLEGKDGSDRPGALSEKKKRKRNYEPEEHAGGRVHLRTGGFPKHGTNFRSPL